MAPVCLGHSSLKSPENLNPENPRCTQAQGGSPVAADLERLSREGITRLRRLASDSHDSLERVGTPRAGGGSPTTANPLHALANPLLAAPQVRLAP